MTSHNQSDLDSAADSVTSSPRSLHDDLQPRVRFMCSFGGRILPRPHDNQLRYVGGDTRIVAVHRATTFSALLTKLSKLSGTGDFTVKYQLPNEDLDALVSVTTDEDVENMIDEYDRLIQTVNSKTARLRLFLFPVGTGSTVSSLGSLLDGKRENWFFDTLNGGLGHGSGDLERGRSEVSSIVSEVPDYLFGLDTSDDPREPKPKTRNMFLENVSISDPGSPAPVTSSPYCSTSSSRGMPPIPDLPPVKTRLESQPIPTVESKENQIEGYVDPVEPLMSQQFGYGGNSMWQYVPGSHYSGPPMQHMPVYYVPGPVQASNVQVQSVPIPAQYIHRVPQPAGLRHPVTAMGQVYGGVMKPVPTMDSYEYAPVVTSDGAGEQFYYRPGSTGMVPAYPPNLAPIRPEFQRSGSQAKNDQAS